MTVSQEEAPEAGSITYWLLVLPAALLPLLNAKEIGKTLLGRSWMLLLFLVSAGLWHFSRGDSRVVIQLGFMVWVLAWLASDTARLAVADFVKLYVIAIVLGIVLYALTDLNKWGPIPGLTVQEYGIWRVSFFPHIAYSGFLSLAVVLVLTRDIFTIKKYPLVIIVATYFLFFSFVRTALIAVLIYAVLRWWFQRRPTSKRMFWTALLVAIGINGAIAGSAFTLVYAQQNPVLSRLLLRGETALSTEEIAQQLYRPWLWWQQIQLFASSPYLMGWGEFDFNAMKPEALVEGHDEDDAVSLPTRLLAAYGLPGALFTLFLVYQLYRLSKQRDAWACACFPAIFLLLMQWGSVFHPSDALFAIFLLIITRGAPAYPGARRNRVTSVRRRSPEIARSIENPIH